MPHFPKNPLYPVLAVFLFLAFQLRAATQTTPPASPSSDVARSLGNTFAAIAEKVSPAVVVITAVRGPAGAQGLESPPDDSDPFDFFYRNPHRAPMPPREQESQGSGFLVSPDGYIYTNHHVIQGADKIKVKLKDGRTFEAHVVGAPDEKTDVAVIKIDAKNLPTVILGDSDAIRPGEWTIAIGAPFNLDYSVTVGVLSGKVRDHLGAIPAGYEEFLQTQATINPGNSGGPLLDIDGKVIGINTLIKTRPGFSFYNANVGFAIPIKLAKKVGDLLMTKGKVERPWLGIDIKTLSEATESKGWVKGVEKGVLITGMQPDTPAYASGLKPLDVITAIDGVPVITARDLQKQVLDKKIGQTVKLNVVRDGKPASIEIKTGLQPSTRQIVSTTGSRPPAPSVPPAFGLTVQPITREMKEQFGLSETQGLLITDVDERSPSARSGLQRGMVITEVDGKKVATAQALNEALKKANPKRGALLQVSVDGFRTFTVLRMESGGRWDSN